MRRATDGCWIYRWTVNTVVNHDEDSEVTDNQETDAPTTATANLVDEVESLLETLSMESDDSSTLQSLRKPRRVVDKSKVVIKRGPLSGQIVSTVRDACRKAFDSQPRRLVAAMFKCETMVNTEALGWSFIIYPTLLSD